jgi:hypothetical protein
VSSTVTTVDVQEIRKCILGLNTNPVNWKFVPQPIFVANNTTTFTAFPLLANFSVVSSASLTPTADFFGVKPGDLDQNCSQCNLFTGSGSDERSIVPQIDATITPLEIKAGQEFTFPIKISNEESLWVYDLELFTDGSLIDILEVQDNLGENGNGDYSIQTETFGEKMRYMWFSEVKEGVKVGHDGTLLYLKLKAKKDLSSLENVLFQKNNSDANQIYLRNEPSKQYNLNLNYQGKVKGFEAKLVNTSQIGDNNLQIFVSTSSNEIAKVSVFDQTGRQVAEKEIELFAGKQTYDVFDNLTTKGVLTVLIQATSGQKTLRLIKI